ncbi:hypothetical protein CAPTEDRAFT_203689 [Capitella teleta]|uniref:Uncharacterized protein n=1 Tax=Capitella teleta TaxID=283909 RepID=R7U5L0_CAPTE|nr:hypothetical protein CAPTEDRAFT_203689 [Capitella teleta]|eukprot:ELT98425.1 hypothetical protein CAPTEDRAFT_203689 [Capitella teleta]
MATNGDRRVITHREIDHLRSASIGFPSGLSCPQSTASGGKPEEWKAGLCLRGMHEQGFLGCRSTFAGGTKRRSPEEASEASRKAEKTQKGFVKSPSPARVRGGVVCKTHCMICKGNRTTGDDASFRFVLVRAEISLESTGVGGGWGVWVGRFGSMFDISSLWGLDFLDRKDPE